MTRRFEGKVGLVTGASRGIGLEIASRLAAEGARVVITARHKAPLDEAVEIIGRGTAVGVAGRADDPEHQRRAVATAVDELGGLDLLVNNAGINPIFGPLIDTDLAAARKILEVNCLAALAWIQASHRAWMAVHGGSIVNVSSVAGLRPVNGIGLYGASKAMLGHLTAGLAKELAPTVRLNAVAPAVVQTRFASPLIAGRESEVADTYPLKRLGTVADVSSAVAFLLSDEASWITGQVIPVDGGITLTGAG